jgi:hypothetical protein
MVKRVASRVLLVGLGVVLSILLFEAGIRFAAVLFPAGDETAASSDDYFVVLCIGDSHTWGHGEGYPARIASVLGERSAKTRVINLGVPGTSTTLLRTRFDGWVDRYRPDAVIVWSGVNNRWNRASTDTLDDHHWLDSSRTLRLLRVWREQRKLSALLEDAPYVAPQTRGKRGKGGTTWKQELLGSVDTIANLGGPVREVDATVQMTELDLGYVADRAIARGVPLVFVTYPLVEKDFGIANRGIRSAASRANAPVVESLDALDDLRHRYPARQARADYLDASAHPTQELYDAVGDRIVDVLTRELRLTSE